MSSPPAGAERQIEVETGVRLRVVSAGRDDAQPIFFSNSLASDLGMWDEVCASLPANHRLIRYDTRGHGRSSVPQGGYSIERLGRDVLAILDALELERVHFCGLSLGGLTGMWLGANAGERLLSLTLANTAASFPPAEMWRDRIRLVRQAGMAELVDPTLDRWLTPAFRTSHAARALEIAHMIDATPVEGYAGCCSILAETDLGDVLERISCPTCVIAGTQDPSTPPARAREIAERVPNARMCEISAAHLSSVEAPSAFAQALLAHIGSRN